MHYMKPGDFEVLRELETLASVTSFPSQFPLRMNLEELLRRIADEAACFYEYLGVLVHLSGETRVVAVGSYRLSAAACEAFIEEGFGAFQDWELVRIALSSQAVTQLHVARQVSLGRIRSQTFREYFYLPGEHPSEDRSIAERRAAQLAHAQHLREEAAALETFLRSAR